MHEQPLEIVDGELKLRVDHDAGKGGGEARAEHQRDIFGRAVGGDIPQLDMLEPAVARVDGLEDLDARLDRLTESTFRNVAFENGKRRALRRHAENGRSGPRSFCVRID